MDVEDTPLLDRSSLSQYILLFYILHDEYLHTIHLQCQFIRSLTEKKNWAKSAPHINYGQHLFFSPALFHRKRSSELLPKLLIQSRFCTRKRYDETNLRMGTSRRT